MGKTRLLAEAKERAHAAGFRVLTARGGVLERGFAFGLVRQLFESMLARAPSDERLSLLDGTGPAAAVLGPPEPGHNPAGDQASLHGLYWLTVNLCADRPLALLIDDLQWGDESSLRFLAYVLPRLEGLKALLVMGVRAREPGRAPQELAHLIADPSCRRLALGALSQQASLRLLEGALSTEVDPVFLDAAHGATRGNPLLLQELARTMHERGLSPTADMATQLTSFGPDAIGERVELWMRRLSPEAVELSRALALLGGESDLAQAAALARLNEQAAWSATEALQHADILMSTTSASEEIRFEHPLVASALYHQLSVTERIDGHLRAASLLQGTGAEAERVAVHLLRTPVGSSPQAREVFRRAAADSLGRGSPEETLIYLRRLLEELPDDEPRETRGDVLKNLGLVAGMVDLSAAAAYLSEAVGLAEDKPRELAELSDALGQVLLYLDRGTEAYTVFDKALTRLPAEAVDLRRRLEAGILDIPVLSPGHSNILTRLPSLRTLPPDDSLGGRELDCLIAMHDAFNCDPGAVARARRALADDFLVQRINGKGPLTTAWLTLLAADTDDVMDLLDNAIAHANLHGSSVALGTAHWCRGLGWLWRGHLSDAATDFEAATSAWEVAHMEAGRPYTASFLAQSRLEQGRLNEAQRVLEAAHPEYEKSFLYMECHSRLLRLQGQYEAALRSAESAGRLFAARGGDNPALVPWRSGAALCLHSLGEAEQAQAYADEELVMARNWTAPRALGRALRVAGLVHGGEQGLNLLREAVDVLDSSPALLEKAKALIDFGAALRRSNQRQAARDPLLRGRELATRCGASAVAQYADAELRASGARPRRVAVGGVDALTPSERRVADLASQGQSNREIAQTLFITPKTVEIHLSSVYRKLGISSRQRLPALLADQTP